MVLSAAGWAAPVSVVDAAGRRISLAAAAGRIISLSPNATELLFAAGAGSRLVGVGRYSDYPAVAARLPVVGDAFAIDVERILSLAPDLIVAWPGSQANPALASLRKLGLPVYTSNPRHLADIPAELEQLGRLAGTEASAKQAAAAYRARLAALRARYAARSSLRVFYQVWPQPLMTIGGHQLFDDALALCGGVNVFARLNRPAATIEREAVLAADPDIIIVGGEAGSVAAWQRFLALRAVRTGQVFRLDAPGLSRQSPRSLDGVAVLCQRLDALRAHGYTR